MQGLCGTAGNTGRMSKALLRWFGATMQGTSSRLSVVPEAC
jgi:hypothetical protein